MLSTHMLTQRCVLQIRAHTYRGAETRQWDVAAGAGLWLAEEHAFTQLVRALDARQWKFSTLARG